MRSRSLSLLAAILFILADSSAGTRCGPRGASDGDVIYLCDVLRAPTRYDGQIVTVRGTFRAALEASELYCLGCTGLGAVYVSFDSDNYKSIQKALHPLPRKIGTADGVFTGRFSANGRYGHMGAYHFQITVTSVRDVRLVDHQGFPPATLTADSRAKVCQ
jgi:hypothetical protein